MSCQVMVAGNWFDYAAQSLTHALVAALVVEALLRMWHARSPDDRLVLRLCGLGQPLFVTPALFLLAPQRAGEDFRDRWALFSARHWQEVTFLGVSAFQAGVVVLAALGSALFLMDLVPLVRSRRRPMPAGVSPPPALEAELAEVAEVAAERHVRAPAIHFLESRAPLLFCSGVRAPVLVVSSGVLALLDPEELRAALRHELAHLARHDPAFSWVLMAVRSVLFFNPVAQVVARALSRDAEWRADEDAGGDRLALASAVLKLYRAGVARAGPGRRLRQLAAFAEPLRRVRSHDVEARCRRLLEPAPPPPLTLRGFRMALVVLSLAVLTSLVS